MKRPEPPSFGNESVDPLADNARKAREQEFHDRRFAIDLRGWLDRLYAKDLASEFYESLVMQLADGRRVLEYGCGTGDLALSLAPSAHSVDAIDISPVAVELAQQRAGAAGASVAIQVMDAEEMMFPSQSFDVVCGSGILHHLDLGKAVPALSRVLADDGQVVFLEPMDRHPLVRAFRRATPSLRSRDEHPLRQEDLDFIADHFEETEIVPYNLFGVVGLLPGCPRWVGRALRRLDRAVMSAWPASARWAWSVVIYAKASSQQLEAPGACTP